MTENLNPPESASQPDRPLPFPAVAEKLDAEREAEGASALYDHAPEEEAEKQMPMTPAVPVPALSPPSRLPRIAAIGGGVLLLGLVIAGLTFFAKGEAQPDVEALPPPFVEAPAKVVTPKVEEPAVEEPPVEEPAVEEPVAKEEPAAKEVVTPKTKRQVKRQLFFTTRALRNLDRTDVDPKDVGPLWKELLALRTEFEGENPNYDDLYVRMQDLKDRAKAIIP